MSIFTHLPALAYLLCTMYQKEGNSKTPELSEMLSVYTVYFCLKKEKRKQQFASIVISAIDSNNTLRKVPQSVLLYKPPLPQQ